jgi:hypothetical protein
VIELVEVRGQRDCSGWPELHRRVVPDLIEQLLHTAAPRLERGDQPALAVESVLDVLIDLGPRIGHDRAVAREDDLELAGAQPEEPVQIRRECAGIGRNEHASLAQDRIARKGGRPSDERKVVGRVTGDRDRLERSEARAVDERQVDASVPAAEWAMRRGNESVRVKLTHRGHGTNVIGMKVR